MVIIEQKDNNFILSKQALCLDLNRSRLLRPLGERRPLGGQAVTTPCWPARAHRRVKIDF